MRTWNYANFLEDRSIEYAALYCGGKSLGDVCPDSIKDTWDDVYGRMLAFYRAIHEARVDLNENCFYDLVPESFLRDFCEIKNKITEHVFENYEKPPNYDLLLEVQKILSEIQVRPLNLEFSALRSKLHQYKTRNWHEKIKKADPYISYNLFGTKTGRLTTKRGSFPALTMPKEYRGIVRPTNEWFLELDFNSAEIRTLLALAGNEQPKEDIHEWNIKHVFKTDMSRDEAKKNIFAWLYNPAAESPATKFYDRDKIKKQYWDGEMVRTEFGREIESDDHHAVNYIIQSTTSDLFLRRMVAVNELLKTKQSHIAFCVHDSLVIDLHSDDKHLVPLIKETFGDTDLGKFKVNLSAGKNYGEMQELSL